MSTAVTFAALTEFWVCRHRGLLSLGITDCRCWLSQSHLVTDGIVPTCDIRLCAASGLASTRPVASAELLDLRGETSEAQVPGPVRSRCALMAHPRRRRPGQRAGSAVDVLPVQLGFEQVTVTVHAVFTRQ
jgi:hypothetical protein